MRNEKLHNLYASSKNDKDKEDETDRTCSTLREKGKAYRALKPEGNRR
jgi:hypothetical protein